MPALPRAGVRQQILQRAKVNDVRNSFDFRLYRGHITASVNGEEVFKNAVPKDTLDAPDKDIRAGLGAYNDSNDTVIRYRNVQIRKLTQ